MKYFQALLPDFSPRLRDKSGRGRPGFEASTVTVEGVIKVIAKEMHPENGKMHLCMLFKAPFNAYLFSLC